MAARFFGRYEHSLDAKGRLILPSRSRAQFGPQAYLSQYQDRCLALWTPEEFEKQMAEMERLQDQGRTQRNLARIRASGSTDVDIDRQGRLAIPAYLRSFALLESGGARHRRPQPGGVVESGRVGGPGAAGRGRADLGIGRRSPSAAATDSSAVPEP